MFGGDSKIFSTDEELSEGNFEKVLDGEASPQEKYIAELKNFKAWYPNRYTFIEQCTTAKEKAIVPVIPNTGGLAYFALKEKEKSGYLSGFRTRSKTNERAQQRGQSGDLSQGKEILLHRPA